MKLETEEQQRYPRTDHQQVHFEWLPAGVTVKDALYWHPPELKDMDGPEPLPCGWVDGKNLELVVNVFVNGKERKPLRYPIPDRDIPADGSDEQLHQRARGAFAAQIQADVLALAK